MRIKMNGAIFNIQSFKIRLLIILFLFQAGNIQSENLKRLANLEGNWKFSIGDNLNWAKPDCDDRDWQKVFVPSSWENNGFEEYNGYAWYRKRFHMSLPHNREYVYLYLGKIDDVDEVYVNGELIGASGTFPPIVKTAHTVTRMYPIPVKLIQNNDENVIAVRVFDEFGVGGITRGPIGVFIDKDQDKLDIDLSGYWNFETASSIDKGNLERVTYQEGKIFIPGFWEARGYNAYDGRGKYTKEFNLPADINTGNKVLLLGMIDDVEEVYLNGEKVELLNLKQRRRKNRIPNYKTFRVYAIPNHLLRKNDLNLIEVMVLDYSGSGGIYKGPIGIASIGIADEIMGREYKDDRSYIEKFIDYWFD